MSIREIKLFAEGHKNSKRSQDSNIGVSDSKVHCFTQLCYKMEKTAFFLLIVRFKQTASSLSIVNPQPPKPRYIWGQIRFLLFLKNNNKQKPRTSILISRAKWGNNICVVNYCVSLWLDLQISWTQGPHCFLLIVVSLALGRCGLSNFKHNLWANQDRNRPLQQHSQLFLLC